MVAATLHALSALDHPRVGPRHPTYTWRGDFEFYLDGFAGDFVAHYKARFEWGDAPEVEIESVSLYLHGERVAEFTEAAFDPERIQSLKVAIAQSQWNAEPPGDER